MRIQINRNRIDEQKWHKNENIRVAFLGIFPGKEVFVAWEPEHVFLLEAKASGSVYARQSQFNKVRTNQVAVYEFRSQKLKRKSRVIALPSEALGFYLENIEKFHGLKSENDILKVINENTAAFMEGGLGSGRYLSTQESKEKKIHI